MKGTAILIAEGDELFRRDLKGRLFQHGFHLIEAPDRTDILQLFLHRKPDLVIIGSSLDDSWDELKVTEQIRQQDRKVPLILITRHRSEARVIGSLRGGDVNDCFNAPFSNPDASAKGKIHGEELRKDNQKAKPSVRGGGTWVQQRNFALLNWKESRADLIYYLFFLWRNPSKCARLAPDRAGCSVRSLSSIRSCFPKRVTKNS